MKLVSEPNCYSLLARKSIGFVRKALLTDLYGAESGTEKHTYVGCEM
jgi:hypothetical protein